MSDNNLRDWTVMVYFAADNDLQDEAFNNLSQMVAVGGTDKLHVLAQIVAREDTKPRRYFMRGPNDAVASELRNRPKTGSVEDLLRFVHWGSSEDHKAHNYLIVLWGHGNGIFDDEEDVGTAQLKWTAPRNKEGTYESKRAGKEPPIDPAVDNALTSFELKEAFEEIRKILGQKVAILGLDACLMSMAEIAHQVSEDVEFMVASEEVVPDKSWPYDRILQKLQELTDTSERPVEAEGFAKAIVDEYITAYESADDPVTLSVCRLEQAGDLTAGLRELGKALRELLKGRELRKAVTKARRETQMFQFRDYVDLYDFCEVLKRTIEEDERFKSAREAAALTCRTAAQACQKLMTVIGHRDGDGSGFVLHSRSTSGTGGPLEKANGVSIYFPPLQSTYADLALSEETHWDTFLHEYMNAVFVPNELRQASTTDFKYKRGDRRSRPLVYATHENGNGSAKRSVEIMNTTQRITDDRNPRLLLPEGTRIIDLLGSIDVTLPDQAFLAMGASAEINVPTGTELDLPMKGNVKASSGTSTKASSGTSTKASSGTSTKASSGTSTKASSGTSTKASSGTSTKAIRTVDGRLEVGWLDVPACTLNMAFSGGEIIDLRNGTRIHPPKGKDGKGGEPIIVIDDVRFVGVDVALDQAKAAASGGCP